MKILIVGLPGSGKSTQLEKLSLSLNLSTVSMGGILRKIAERGDELGQKILAIMKSGELVDDKTVSEFVKAETENLSGFVMEGYPRTLEQIELYDPKFDRVYYLEVPMGIAKQRMKGRGRQDDSDQAIEVRLRVQREDMEKILEYYKDVLVEINGLENIEEVFRQMIDKLPNI